MPDLYVNSGSGADAADRGDTPSDALRSVTFAVDEAARRFGSARTAIHLAAGTYDRSAGEVFPIEIPQNVSVIGAGRDSTFIVVERAATDTFNVALSGGEELSAFTLRGLPVDPASCSPLAGIVQIVGATFIHDLAVELAPTAADDEVGFASGMRVFNTGRVERVSVTGCNKGIVFGGGTTITACSISGNDTGLYATGTGTATDCDVTGNHTGIAVYSGTGATVSGNRIDRNKFGVTIEISPSWLLTPRPTVRDNQVTSNTYNIVCFADADIVSNDVVCTDSEQSGLLAGTTFPAGLPARDTPVMHPLFRDNRVRREGRNDLSRRQAPLMIFGSTSAPTVEGNRLWTVEGWQFGIVTVHHDAMPDFGGGGRSAGHNRFEGGWLIFYQDDESPMKTIYARDNAWPRLPVVKGASVYGPGNWYVDPWPRRDSVALRTEGATAA